MVRHYTSADTRQTTPSGCACHPSTGGEWSGTILVQNPNNHPVRLRLLPLHRRGMVRHYTCADTRQPPRQAAPATPPQRGMVRHYTSAEPQQPPRQAAPATPPKEGNGPAPYLCRTPTTTPSGCACHPSTGGEWSGTILVQNPNNHPVRLRLPPLHRRGMVRHYTCADTRQPPRQAAPATPPQEGNGPALY